MENELMEMVESYLGKGQSILFGNELIRAIENDPRGFTIRLSNAVEEVAGDENCPLCGEELDMLSVSEERSEYFGRVVSENIPRIGCSSNTCYYVKE